MKYFYSALITICLTIIVFHFSQDSSRVTPRFKPHFIGVDSRAYPLALEYVIRAGQHNIKFTRYISIGFTDINAGRVVGVCFRGSDFREIIIDNKEWNNTPYETRKELLFHELTHCLCGRGHDYGSGKNYPPPGMERIVELFHKWPFYMSRPGRFEDGCPTSIMFPYVLPKSCLDLHNKEYMDEMFNRCDAW